MIQLSQIKLLALDVDGVLTDGGLYYGPHGVSQRFNSRDGGAIIRLRRSGFPVALISLRDFPATRRRAADLGIDLLCLGTTRKAQALSGLCTALSIDVSESLFMGDGLMDLEAIMLAGVAACPSNAHPEIIQHCDIVTKRPGGDGAVWEIVQMLTSGDEQ